MKNNSFKQFGPFQKKLVLTALLATVLSGPYVYQISSKDFHFEEFASTAAEYTEADKAETAHKAKSDFLLERLKKANPVKYAAADKLPPSAEITDEALKKQAAGLEAERDVLDGKKLEREREKRIKEAEKKRRDEIEAEAKAEKERADVAERAEKKKKEEAAEAKRLDCNDKDKDAKEKRECRETAKREEAEKKAEEASKKFDDKLETTWRACESRSEKMKDSSTRLDTAEDVELACKAKGFIKAMSTRDKNLSVTAVNAQFRELLGNDLFAMLYSDNEHDAERASIILSNIFNGKVPAQYAGLKRMIMIEVLQRAKKPAEKVAAEFRKANQLPQKSPEHSAQYNLAITAKTELDNRIEAYSSSMYYPLAASGDQDALSYYRSSYLKGKESLAAKMLTGSSTIGGASGGALRGGESRGGTSTEARVVTTADGKMVRTGGVEYSLLSPGTVSNIRFSTPSSTRSTDNTRGVVRVSQ